VARLLWYSSLLISSKDDIFFIIFGKRGEL